MPSMIRARKTSQSVFDRRQQNEAGERADLADDQQRLAPVPIGQLAQNRTGDQLAKRIAGKQQARP